MIIATVVRSALAIVKASIFIYKVFQQSEIFRTQISCIDCRQCPSQGVLRSCCCSSGDSRKSGESVSKCLPGNHKEYREKVRPQSFSVPAASRLLLCALYTVHCAMYTGTTVHPFWEQRGSAENTVSLWGQCIPLSHGCSAPWSHLPRHDKEDA